MREIKFRAWDNEMKRMSNPFTLGDNVITWNDGDVAMPVIFAGHKAEQRGRFIFLQYTGLKDKNGKEIYDRDVINEYDSDRGRNIKPKTLVVKWDDKNGSFIADGFFPFMDFDLCEVIGNIYETPERLKDKKLCE